jgi:hypothetical protein
MPLVDADARLQALDENGIIQLRSPMALERRQKDALIVRVGRERAGDAGDIHGLIGCRSSS